MIEINKRKRKTWKEYYQQRDKEKIKIYNRNYRLENPEKVKEWREKYKARKKEKAAKYYQKNKEREKKKSLDYRNNHLEERIIYNRKYIENLKYLPEEKQKELKGRRKNSAQKQRSKADYKIKMERYHREWYQKNKEKDKKHAKEWKENNREQYRNIQRRRKLRKKGAKGSHSFKEWKLLLDKYNHRCGYCGKGDGRLERDHLIPIVHGGSDFIENVIPACRSCNASKGTKNQDQFWEIANKFRKEIK